MQKSDPAFPHTQVINSGGIVIDRKMMGLSKREYASIQISAGLVISVDPSWDDEEIKKQAQLAVRLAEALEKEWGKEVAK